MKMQKKWVGLLLAVALMMMAAVAMAAPIEVKQYYTLRSGVEADNPGLIMYANGGMMDLSDVFNCPPDAQDYSAREQLGKLLFGNSFMLNNRIAPEHKEHASQFDYQWELDAAALQWDGTEVIKKGYKASFNNPGVFDNRVQAYIQLDYFPGEALAKLYVGKDKPLATCTITKDGETVAVVECMLQDVRQGVSVLQKGPSQKHEVVTSGSYTFNVDSARYSIPEQYQTDEYEVRFRWQLDGESFETTTVPSLTLEQEKLNNAYNKELNCWIRIYKKGTDEKVTESPYWPSVVLHDGRYPYIDMTADLNNDPSIITAEAGEQVILSVPAVTICDGRETNASNKTVEYHWYKHNADHRPYIHIGTTTVPQITVTHDAAGNYMYECAASFVGGVIPSNGCNGENYAFTNNILEVVVSKPGSVFYNEITVGGKARRTVVEPNLQNVPGSMDNVYNLSTMKSAMLDEITAKGDATGSANTLFEIQLQQHPISSAVGDQISHSADWSGVSAGLFPTDGVEFTIPYPAGTNADTEFSASHIFATEGGDFEVGEIEVLDILRKTSDGVVVKVHGTSPVLLTYSPAVVPSNTPSVPTTGDNTPIALLIGMLFLSATIGVYSLSRKRSA